MKRVKLILLLLLVLTSCKKKDEVITVDENCDPCFVCIKSRLDLLNGARVKETILSIDKCGSMVSHLNVSFQNYHVDDNGNKYEEKLQTICHKVRKSKYKSCIQVRALKLGDRMYSYLGGNELFLSDYSISNTNTRVADTLISYICY